jgi:hypothetical protein
MLRLSEVPMLRLSEVPRIRTRRFDAPRINSASKRLVLVCPKFHLLLSTPGQDSWPLPDSLTLTELGVALSRVIAGKEL